jgi:hypothetical protein
MTRNSSIRIGGGIRARLTAAVAVLAAMLAWLWPIGIGGKMPVGGDVTQFFLGLMGFLSDSLRAGQIPAWNDLWGYGFPGLAESQMGVYYLPHALLYRNLNTETAYVVSLVLHTLWGALGLFWASRRMGISAVGSALAAFSWSACGFFLIHLAHPWGYTTGCWMPWAFGLAWTILAPGAGTVRMAPLLLSLVLVLQVLLGHFQLAFETQVVLGVMVFWTISAHWASALVGRNRGPSPGSGTGPALRKGVAVVLAVAAVFPLAAIQLWPTARLAGLADDRRGFEYLSGFAATPFHLVNYVAPGLFHRSAMWRPLVWDPFHAMPEESLTYIGLAPLFLAVMTVMRDFRRDPAVRLLTILAVITLILGSGPYAPGFRALITLPGFSFFRAPARWSLATALALAVLAGKGFDRWPDWPRAGRSLRWFIGLAIVWIVAVLGLIELAVISTERTSRGENSASAAKMRWTGVVGWFDRAFRAMPWTDDPSFEMKDPSFEQVMAGARQPVDPHVPRGLPLRLAVVLQKSVADKIFVMQRGWIYLKESWETAVFLALLWAVAGMMTMGRARTARVALLLITFLDLWVLGQHRLIDVAPLGPLTSQSPLLASLAREPRGTRTADPLRNLPMLAGLAPISYYRTLNLPAVEALTRVAMEPMSGPVFEPMVRSALRATGTSLRIFSPLENRINHVLRRTEHTEEMIEDPALARWLYGASWADEQGDWVQEFSIWRSEELPVRAWYLPFGVDHDETILDDWSGDPKDILPLFDRAQPLEDESPRPEEWTIRLFANEPGWVIVSQLHDPQWKARWIGLEGQREFEVPILPAFQKHGEPGGWQRVEMPGEGKWMLRLEYDPRDAMEGAAITMIAWASWLVCACSIGLRAVAGRFRTRRDESET